jgi:hypothetical protein
MNLKSNIKILSFPDDEYLVLGVFNEIINETMRSARPHFDFHSNKKDDLLETQSKKFDRSVNGRKTGQNYR